MRDHIRGEAPNYTNACIVMFGVNIMWILTLIWAVWGFLAAVFLGIFVNHMMTRLEAWSRARSVLRISEPDR